MAKTNPLQKNTEREERITMEIIVMHTDLKNRRWEKDGLAVPLSQLTPINSAEFDTRQAVEDWHYWVRMGYRLG